MIDTPAENEARLELTAEEWRRAEALARELKGVDRNEFGKVITYLRRTKRIDKFFVLLRALPDSNFLHSKNKTREYFVRISQASEQYLKGLPPQRAVLVATWAFRLMTYYRGERT